ncbi:MAG TPA: glycosyltransferase family 4 protein [Chloroflexaceae bacterium]|nr:glycosyltransferase family 4 protein [Chloroflexaceae bacterium]
MRVAYVCADPGVPAFGRKGSSVHVQSVVQALLRRGARVSLFAARLDGPPPPGLAAVACHALPRPPKGEAATREAAMLAANAELASALEREGPFDLVYERYSLWSYAGMEHAYARGLPGLLEVNAPLIQEQAHHRELVDRAGAERAAWRAFGAASALLAVSEGVADYLRGSPAAQGRVFVIPNGVDPARFPPRRPAAARPFTVGFVGTLKPWHGLDVLLDAFARLRARAPEARLLIVGDGPERGAVERRSASLGLDGAVRLTGAVPPAAIPGLLREMDAATAPYPAAEQCYFSPLKLFEYMAAGLPVVASRVGQVAAVVEHGRSGLLCPPGDAGALAEALAMLRADPGLRARLGAAARAEVMARHTWDAVAGRILDLAGLGRRPLGQVRHA